MKKNIIITVIAVLVIAAVCMVSFAAWDIKTDSVEFNVFNGADNVKLTVKASTTAAVAKLIPTGANASGAGESDRIIVGDFELKLTSDGGSSQDELKAKAKVTIGSITITSAATSFDAASMIIVRILKADTAGTITINSAKYSEVTSTTAANLKTLELGIDTKYFVSIEFVPGFKDTANAANLANAKKITTVVNFNCVGKQ